MQGGYDSDPLYSVSDFDTALQPLQPDSTPLAVVSLDYDSTDSLCQYLLERPADVWLPAAHSDRSADSISPARSPLKDSRSNIDTSFSDGFTGFKEIHTELEVYSVADTVSPSRSAHATSMAATEAGTSLVEPDMDKTMELHQGSVSSTEQSTAIELSADVMWLADVGVIPGRKPMDKLGRLNIPLSCFQEDIDEHRFRPINDIQYERLKGIFAEVAVSEMRTPFVAVTLQDEPDISQLVEPGREYSLEIVRKMADQRIPNFLTVKGGNHRLKLFKAKVAANEMDAHTMVDTVVYTRPSEDDAIALATEDNISVNSTLAITFWDVICTMRDVSFKIVNVRKSADGTPMVIRDESPLPKPTDKETQAIKVKFMRRFKQCTELQYCNTVSRYFELARYPAVHVDIVHAFFLACDVNEDRMNGIPGKPVEFCNGQKLGFSTAVVRQIWNQETQEGNHRRNWDEITELMGRTVKAKNFFEFTKRAPKRSTRQTNTRNAEKPTRLVKNTQKTDGNKRPASSLQNNVEAGPEAKSVEPSKKQRTEEDAEPPSVTSGLSGGLEFMQIDDPHTVQSAAHVLPTDPIRGIRKPDTRHQVDKDIIVEKVGATAGHKVLPVKGKTAGKSGKGHLTQTVLNPGISSKSKLGGKTTTKENHSEKFNPKKKTTVSASDNKGSAAGSNPKKKQKPQHLKTIMEGLKFFQSVATASTEQVVLKNTERLLYLAPMFCTDNGLVSDEITGTVNFRVIRTPEFNMTAAEGHMWVCDYGWFSDALEYTPVNPKTEEAVQVRKTSQSVKDKKEAWKDCMFEMKVAFLISLPCVKDSIWYGNNRVSFEYTKHDQLTREYLPQFFVQFWKEPLNYPVDIEPTRDEDEDDDSEEEDEEGDEEGDEDEAEEKGDDKDEDGDEEGEEEAEEEGDEDDEEGDEEREEEAEEEGDKEEEEGAEEEEEASAEDNDSAVLKNNMKKSQKKNQKKTQLEYEADHWTIEGFLRHAEGYLLVLAWEKGTLLEDASFLEVKGDQMVAWGAHLQVAIANALGRTNQKFVPQKNGTTSYTSSGLKWKRASGTARKLPSSRTMI